MSQLERGDIFAGSYELISHLGSGGFAEVWKARYKLGNFDGSGDDVIVALKIYAPSDGLDQDGIRIFQREFAKTNNLNHNHLLKTQHFDIYQGSPYLVLPYCAEGSLMSFVARGVNFSKKEMVFVMSHIGGGFYYLHQKRIAHQDIKPANILVREKNDYVISDFGISTKVRKTIAISSGDEATENYSAFAPAYAPPERYTARPAPEGDVFALGVSLYELGFGDTPFDDTGEAIKQGGSIPYLSGYSEAFNEIIRQCTTLNPAERPAAADLESWANYYLQNGHWPNEKKQQKSPWLKYAAMIVGLLVCGLGGYFALNQMQSGQEAERLQLIENEYTELMTKANKAKDEKKIDQAILLFGQAITKKPNETAAIEGKKSCETIKQEYDQQLTEAGDLEKKNKLSKAKKVYEKAMALIPSPTLESTINNLKGRIAAANVKPSPAPVKVKPEKGPDVGSLIVAAENKITAGQWAEARSLYMEARQKNPYQCCKGKERPFVNMANKMRDLGSSTAVKYYQYAKDVNPRYTIPQQ